MLKMYEIQDGLIDLLRASDIIMEAEENGADPDKITELKEQLQHEWDIAGSVVQDKIDGVVRLLKNLKAEQDALKAEVDRLAKKAKSREKQIAFIKEHLIKPTLELLPDKKVKTIIGSVYFMNTESVEILDIGKIPSQYKEPVTTWKVDKKALKFDLKENEATQEDIPGCFLQKNKSVVIR